MKKMVIVPFRMLEDMERIKSEHRPRLPPNPQVVHTADLRQDMDSVLQQDHLSESEKAQQYGETLQKLQHAHKKALSYNSTPTSSESQPPPPTTDPVDISIRDRVVDSVPQTLQRKAKLLLNLIEKHPHMRWDHQGVLEYQGKPVAGSNVIDLVNDVIRQRKGSKPKGWEQFAKGLRDINAPQEVVGNRQRWTYMQKADEDGDVWEDASFTLPPTPPPSSKKKYKTKGTTSFPSSSSWEAY